MAGICWICGKNPADSGEHFIQRADVSKILPKGGRAYFHNFTEFNKEIHSAKGEKRLKKLRICSACNGTLTQLHDKAWQAFSNACDTAIIKSPSQYYAGMSSLDKKMINLFFVKKLGCVIEAAGLPIDLKYFSQALLTDSYYQEVDIKVHSPDGAFATTLRVESNGHGQITGLGLRYSIKSVTVDAMYIPTSEILKLQR